MTFDKRFSAVIKTRGIPYSPESAECHNPPLVGNNVPSVRVGDYDIPVQVMMLDPPLELGFELPIYPILVSDTPQSWDAYKSMVLTFIKHILPKFPRHLDLSLSEVIQHLDKAVTPVYESLFDVAVTVDNNRKRKASDQPEG